MKNPGGKMIVKSVAPPEETCGEMTRATIPRKTVTKVDMDADRAGGRDGRVRIKE